MTTSHRVPVLPLPSVIGLNREQAAAFVGVGVTLFDQLVAAGKMPAPRTISSGRYVYDVEELGAAFRAMPHKNEIAADNDDRDDNPPTSANPWDRNAGKA